MPFTPTNDDWRIYALQRRSNIAGTDINSVPDAETVRMVFSGRTEGIRQPDGFPITGTGPTYTIGTDGNSEADQAFVSGPSGAFKYHVQLRSTVDFTLTDLSAGTRNDVIFIGVKDRTQGENRGLVEFGIQDGVVNGGIPPINEAGYTGVLPLYDVAVTPTEAVFTKRSNILSRVTDFLSNEVLGEVRSNIVFSETNAIRHPFNNVASQTTSVLLPDTAVGLGTPTFAALEQRGEWRNARFLRVAMSDPQAGFPQAAYVIPKNEGTYHFATPANLAASGSGFRDCYMVFGLSFSPLRMTVAFGNGAFDGFGSTKNFTVRLFYTV